MNGIGRNVVWLLLPVVWACEADDGSSSNLVDGASSDATGNSETSGHTAGPSTDDPVPSGAPAASSHHLDSSAADGATTDGAQHSETDASNSESTSPDTSASAGHEVSTAPIVVGERALGARCERSERLGALGVNLTSDRTIIAGAVSSGVLPSSVPDVAAEAGACQLLVPRDLFCSSCEANQACAGDDMCVVKPSKVSAGTLHVDGLLVAAEVAPNGITLDYSKTILDPFPAYVIGEPVTVRAAGDFVGGFEAELLGISSLTSESTAVAVKHGQPAVLSWNTEGVDPEETVVFVSFSVNVHGAVTGWIECTAPDTGEFEIPAELVSQLIDLGSSGFPRVDLERRSSAIVEIEQGCVELYVGSKITMDIELDGLTSCHDDDDCDEDQTCNAELACE